MSEILVVGDKVHYIPFDGCSEDKYENGIVKSIPTSYAAFVVYHCDGKWDDYQNYTAALTSIEDLRPGWK